MAEAQVQVSIVVRPGSVKVSIDFPTGDNAPAHSTSTCVVEVSTLAIIINLEQ